MKLLRIPKLPKIKLPMPRKPAAPKKLHARMRAAEAPLADYDEEPQTKLTSAFIVVLILHVVAVGGIYAFNQIKASRRGGEIAPIGAQDSREVSRKSEAPTESPRKAQADVAPASPVAPVAPTLKQRVYSVKPGDSLMGIAKTFGVSMADLKAVNGLSSDVIHPGQVLNLPNGKAAAETPAAVAPKPVVAPKQAEPAESKLTYKNYTVKSGDRLVFIAKKFGVSQEDLVALNKMKDPSKLQIGQTLKIPVKKGN